MFTIDLPALAGLNKIKKDANSNLHETNLNEESNGVEYSKMVRLNKVGFLLNSLESNAHSYLKTLDDSDSESKDKKNDNKDSIKSSSFFDS